MTEIDNDLRKVALVSHDDKWLASFELEEERLRNLFDGHVVSIHHIGSTSIPGIVSRNTVDIVVEVKNLQKIDQFIPGMKQLGYFLAPGGDKGPRRVYYKKGMTDPTHVVYFYEKGDVEIARCINFRDYIKTHPALAVKYSNLKQALSKKYPFDVDAYNFEKVQFIENVEIEIILWKKNIEKDLF